MLNYRELDWRIIGAALALSLIGILMILSAQYHADTTYEQTYYQRQLLWLLFALVGFAIVIHIPLRLIDLSAYLVYGVSIVLLVLVLLIGRTDSGPARWFAFGPINLAPSDVAKIALLLALSRFLAYTKLNVVSKRRLAVTAMLTILPVALIVKQPDLGTALVFPVILLILWFWSGLTPWYLLMILSPIISLVAASHWLSWAIYLVVLLVFLFVLRPGMVLGLVAVLANLASGIVTPMVWGRLADYQKLRILTFIDPARDPRGAGYQIIQSKISIGSGGILGKGYLDGSQTRLDFLPERHTDFIFSVLGEELGLWGALIVLTLFAIIFYQAIRIAGRCRSRFASLLVIGSAGIILFQVLINVGMTLGIMPVTGLALPFLSYGGTSLMLFWGLIGFMVLADYYWQEY
jgi:rod shape determining protein RodA